MKNRGAAILAVATVLVVLYVIPSLRTTLVWPLLEGRTFSSQFLWFEPVHAIYWAFAFAWSFAAGAIGAAVFPSSWLQAAAMTGAVAGLTRALTTRNWIAEHAGWSTYVWVYGEYFVPLVGAIVGAALVHRLLTWRRLSAT